MSKVFCTHCGKKVKKITMFVAVEQEMSYNKEDKEYYVDNTYVIEGEDIRVLCDNGHDITEEYLKTIN